MKDGVVKELVPGHTGGQTEGMRNWKRIMILAVCMVLAAGILFAGNYSVPVPFDPNRMFIEKVASAFVTDKEYGGVYVTDIDHMGFQETKAALSGNLDVLDLVWFTQRGIYHAGFWSKGRTISRNGETVRVVYYRYTKTLLDLMLPSDLFAHSESLSTYGEIYSDSPARSGGDHVMERREIYYLPVRNLGELDGLSDEEYDAMRERASLIWSGRN